MIFNKGFICVECGPMKDAIKRAATKALPARHVCPHCSKIVQVWERPLNERAGRCNNCAGASFTSAVWKGHILRKCKKCDEVFDTDAMNVKRKGKKEFEYKVK